jgi:hypothetical protein
VTTPETGSSQAVIDWATIDGEGRLHLSSEITECLSWFTPKKRMGVSIDLSSPAMITIRHLADVTALIQERREALLEETDELAPRRVAMTYHFFREATLIVPERRIGLKAIVQDHLDAKPGDRLLCLAFADRIEAYSEVSARQLILRHARDLIIGS